MSREIEMEFAYVDENKPLWKFVTPKDCPEAEELYLQYNNREFFVRDKYCTEPHHYKCEKHPSYKLQQLTLLQLAKLRLSREALDIFGFDPSEVKDIVMKMYFGIQKIKIRNCYSVDFGNIPDLDDSE